MSRTEKLLLEDGFWGGEAGDSCSLEVGLAAFPQSKFGSNPSVGAGRSELSVSVALGNLLKKTTNRWLALPLLRGL